MKQVSLITAFTLWLPSMTTHSQVLAPVVVTATRSAQSFDESLAPVTVITREEIESQQAHSVLDLLRGLNGVDTTNHGGEGKMTSISLRGTETDHTLLIVDGIKIGSATTGMPAWQDIPIDAIERIEIVRGPRSSLYGADAVGGVIQIFTRNGEERSQQFFSLGGGQYKTVRGNAGFTRYADDTWFGAYISGMDTAGYNACNGKPGPNGAGCFTDEPDIDGYRSFSAGARAGFRYRKNHLLEWRFLRAQGTSDFDGGFVNRTRTTQQLTALSLRSGAPNALQFEFTAGRAWDLSSNFLNDDPRSHFDTARDTLNVQAEWPWLARHLLTLGTDYQRERVDSDIQYLENVRRQRGVYAQYTGDIFDQRVEVSARKEIDSRWDRPLTGGIAWGYRYNSLWRVSINASSAFKAPSFNELYFPGYSNPALRPELARSLDAGIELRVAPLGIDLHAYETHIDNLIAFDAALGTPNNIDSARLRGLEFALSGSLHQWMTRLQFSVLDTANLHGEYTDRKLPRRAPWTWRAQIDRAYAYYSFGMLWRGEGPRYDDLANATTLSAYATLDLHSEIRLGKSWRAQMSISNLFNQAYETVAYYNQPGRAFFINFRYNR